MKTIQLIRSLKYNFLARREGRKIVSSENLVKMYVDSMLNEKKLKVFNYLLEHCAKDQDFLLYVAGVFDLPYYKQLNFLDELEEDKR